MSNAGIWVTRTLLTGHSPMNDPGKSIRRRDDREEIWIHKEFSEEAQYRVVLPTEENFL